MDHQDDHLPAPEHEDLYESLLIAYDEALARGDALPLDESRVPPELLPRLRAALSCVSLLARARPTGASLPAVEVQPGGRPAAWPLKAQIGRFELLREIGRGGHGVVFLAVDPRLRRLVALKVPRPEVLMTPDLHRRFLLEGRAASGLAHPNLVPIHEVGDDGPLCYIAAGYCEGRSLANWLKEHAAPFAWHEAAALIARLADATAHAHSRGVLHRDIKPANILLAPAEPGSLGASTLARQSVTPCLTDFGLARLMDEDASDGTRTGTMLGTPSYMAPEQAAGRNDEIGPATDVYALGAVLYELLVRRPPFRGANDLETIRLVTAAELVAPSTLRPEVPRDLEAICLKALSASPADRYASAADLAADLRRFAKGEPTQARPLSTLRQMARWARRRPLVAALLGVCLAAAGVIASGGWWYSAQMAAALEEARNARRRSDVLRHAAETRSAWQAFNVGHGSQAAKLLLVDDFTELLDEDPRNFAWQLLWQRLHDERLTLSGHQGAVYAVAYSPDGRTLASAGQDRSVRVWDSATGDCLAVFNGHSDEVNAVAWSPDGRLLASAGDDGAVRLWDAARRRPLRILPSGPHGAAVSLAFSPDGAQLACGCNDGSLIFFDADNWQTKRRIVTGDKRIEALAFSPDGALLATANGLLGVRVWNVAEGRAEPKRSPHAMGAFGVAFDRASHFAGCGYGWLDLWNLQTDQVLASMRAASQHIQSLAFCLDDRMIAIGRADGAVQLFEAESGNWARTFLGHADRVWCVAASPDGRSLATASADQTIKIWGLTGSNAETIVAEAPKIVDAVAFTPDGKSLLSTASEGFLTLWEVRRSKPSVESPAGGGGVLLENPRRLAQAGELPGPIQSMAIAPDGTRAATCSRDESGVRLWNLRTRAADGEPLVARRTAAIPTCFSVAYSPDGRFLAQGADKQVYLWNAASRKLQTVLGEHAELVRSLAFSPNGRRLAVAVAAGDELVVWDHGARRVLKTWRVHGGHANKIAYSLDGRLLASAGSDRLVKLWDAATGAEAGTFSGHTDAVRDLAFSPDGRLLATGGDGTVRLWSLATYGELAVVSDFVGAVFSLAFSPTEMVLAVGGVTPRTVGEIRLWCGPPGTKWRPTMRPDEEASVSQ